MDGEDGGRVGGVRERERGREVVLFVDTKEVEGHYLPVEGRQANES